MRITRTLTTAIAIAALVAPAAQARPADPPDMHASVALAAAEARERQERAPRPPGHPGADRAPAPTVITETADPARAHAADERGGGGASGRDSGIRWSTIGLGVLGSLLAAGGFAALSSRRTQRLRVGV